MITIFTVYITFIGYGAPGNEISSFQYNFYLNIFFQCDWLHVLTFRHAHPGNPYVYGLAAVDHDLNFPEPMPVVGIVFFF